ncbi:MAG: nuclear transport factor 2 family protein [Deltaproteobacteria bacterium]|jgi:hypothetical protein|nr:nuclear transport factor 2 family protein [Deltaproteobacteria bacterium]MBW2497710.1 nuclear transport factor 2 family protein [Deltaproteobacteria bacterium]
MGNAPERDQEIACWRAERAIGRVMLTYARAVDQLDFEALASCFHSDARIHYGDYFSGNLEEGLAFLERQLPRLGGTMHIFGPPWIELDLAAGRAECETYAVTSALYPPDEQGVQIQNVSGTRYLDRFEEREGRWAIVERRNMGVWRQNVPASESPPMPT